jgi:hypothetical protein
LKAGSIFVEKNGNMAVFRIRDRKSLEKLIFPIFDKYSLLTNKEYNYAKFKQAYAILTNTVLTNLEKDIRLLEIENYKPSVNFISSAWSIIDNNVSNYETASKVMSKA